MAPRAQELARQYNWHRVASGLRLDKVVHDTIKDRTAGDPMRTDVVWTDMTPQAIADSLRAHTVCVGPRIVRRMRQAVECLKEIEAYLEYVS